jgi:hypothetical protein
MDWYAFDDGKTLGERGSEEGVITRDEELDDGARITLEREARGIPFAITCGIYGWMVHTRFFGAESEAEAAYQNMRDDIGRILAVVRSGTDPDGGSRAVSQLISQFFERFP